MNAKMTLLPSIGRCIYYLRLILVSPRTDAGVYQNCQLETEALQVSLENSNRRRRLRVEAARECRDRISRIVTRLVCRRRDSGALSTLVMVWTNTLVSSLPMPPPLSTALLLPLLFHSCSCQLLEIFGLSTGDAGTVERQPFHDLARWEWLLAMTARVHHVWDLSFFSQSVGLINYLQTVQRNPDNQLAKKCVGEREKSAK